MTLDTIVPTSYEVWTEDGHRLSIIDYIGKDYGLWVTAVRWDGVPILAWEEAK